MEMAAEMSDSDLIYSLWYRINPPACSCVCALHYLCVRACECAPSTIPVDSVLMGGDACLMLVDVLLKSSGSDQRSVATLLQAFNHLSLPYWLPQKESIFPYQLIPEYIGWRFYYYFILAVPNIFIRVFKVQWPNNTTKRKLCLARCRL